MTLIGATTENPTIEVNSALLSRTQIYELQPLGESEDVEEIVPARGGGSWARRSQVKPSLSSPRAGGDAPP